MTCSDVKNLGRLSLDIEGVDPPYIVVKYANPNWLRRKLPQEIISLLDFMSLGLPNPRWSYIFRHLRKGERFGHGQFHVDGLGSKNEIHRLVIFGGESTLGIDGLEMTTNSLWQFPGDYLHKSQPVLSECDRLLLRVSDNGSIKYRNFVVRGRNQLM